MRLAVVHAFTTALTDARGRAILPRQGRAVDALSAAQKRFGMGVEVIEDKVYSEDGHIGWVIEEEKP